jgi:6-phosphogluconolactonase (cycloisomerase 2 family)
VPAFQLSFIAEEPFGSGSGPQCIVEDPSEQFIYEASEYDSAVTGRVLDPNTGDLNDLRVLDTYKLQGPASWCLVDGRTS